jgi:hypothetical protein
LNDAVLRERRVRADVRGRVDERREDLLIVLLALVASEDREQRRAADEDEKTSVRVVDGREGREWMARDERATQESE